MRHVHIKLVGPAILGISLLLAGMATAPYLAASRVDADIRLKQEKMVERNVSVWISEVEYSLTSWTVWDEAIAKLDNTFDKEWAERNIGASLIGTSRVRSAIVLDADGKVIYFKTDATFKDLPFFKRGTAAMKDDATQLVDAVREKEKLRKPEGIPPPIAVSGIKLIGGEAVLLSASLFQPDFGTARPKGARGPILITAMPLGSTLQDVFGTRFDLMDARISSISEVSAERARVEIAEGPTGEIEVLSWKPPTPATDILFKIIPLNVTVGLVILAGGIAMVRMSQSTARALIARERMMHHAATYDSLTNLLNRSTLEQQFRMFTASGITQVVCLDLDGFKGVNDRLGHAAGDALLIEIASRLRSATRSVDRIFRLGGDEFVILMPGLSLQKARDICVELSTTLAAPVQLSRSEVSIGASFGVSQGSYQEMRFDVVLKAADVALYQAKVSKRGSVVIDTDQLSGAMA